MLLPFLPYLDPIGAVLSLLTTVSFVRVRRAGWVIGLFSTALKVILYLDRGLYGQVGLKCVFLGMMVYGWFHWGKPKAEQPAPTIQSLGLRGWMMFLVSASIGILLLHYVLTTHLNASGGWRDATITVLALCAQFLLCQKIIENWILWFVINLMGVTLLAEVGLPFNAAVHFCYLFLAVLGYRNWRQIQQQEQAVLPL
jgi:nicotinamide mononucleotide transporter